MSQRKPGKRAIRVAVLGCGTVGGEVARQLLARAEEFGVELVAVLVRDAQRERSVPRELVTTVFERVLARQPEIVVEAVGGAGAAAEYVLAALRAGAHVVTANKTLLAQRGDELRRAASEAGVALRHEGAAAGAAPVFAVLEQLRGDRVVALRGVVNGTCNYILTRLEAGIEFGEALAEAQRKGFAEADPSADVSGRDSAEKLCILAHEAGFPGMVPEDIHVEGIERVTPDDLRAARRSRHVLRLVVELEVADEGLHARVGPTLVPEAHPLARLRAEENGVVIRAALAGQVFVQGRGAGGPATASAVLGDLLRVLAAVRRAYGQAPKAAACPPFGDLRRTQVVRVQAPPERVTPDHILGRLDEHGVRDADLALERGRARASAVLKGREAIALGLAVAGVSGESLVTPVLS